MDRAYVDFINPFLQGTIEALSIQCNVQVNPGVPFLKGKKQQPSFEIAAVIGLASPEVSGTIALLFTNKVYLSIISSWLGEEVKEMTSETRDGAAELLNIIYGSAKVAWNDRGGLLQKALPICMTGSPIQVSHLEKSPVLVVPFITPFGEFHVEICTSAAKGHKAA